LGENQRLTESIIRQSQIAITYAIEGIRERFSTKRVVDINGYCNDPTIGSYNHYDLSLNGIPSGNQRWNGLVYLVYT